MLTNADSRRSLRPPTTTVYSASTVTSHPLYRHRPLGHVRRWRHPPVYRPLVDLSTMEERHVIITYRLDRATILELCAQLEPDLISAIRHPTEIPPQVQMLSEQVYRNQKSYHSMNVQMVCLADQYISHVNAKFPGSVHDAYILRNSSIPYMMGQLKRHRVWLLALRRQVPFLQEDGPDGGVVAAVEPVDSEDKEAEEEDIDNWNSVILQYFQ
ncbi:hypothetical protein NDU88_005037 [Pleurodeles waltl]|uniref:DDE Tnp4 domain-containing protein n=1 Tax=Pleurodeles waltl TaxID=8319 RepID=A0AAV7WTL8_PLEWA|nr:hypothetical protein NDU88_005037 [Pleurodeles waltl]